MQSSTRLCRPLLTLDSPLVVAKRFKRTPFGNPKPTYEERNRVILNLYKKRRLELATPIEGRPMQFEPKPLPAEPEVVVKERKLPSLVESASPYQKYSQENIDGIKNYETFYDPLFNPHLHEERHRVNPDEEPFSAIYSDSKSEAAHEYTSVRDITTPILWDYVERLARIKIAPQPRLRKAGEPIVALPSGFIPPPETPPDLPYFVPRTRNYLLPVYYKLHNDPEECYTMIKLVSGDLWKLAEDVRIHLESLDECKQKILTGVQETDARIMFRGRWVHQVVDWLHNKGF